MTRKEKERIEKYIFTAAREFHKGQLDKLDRVSAKSLIKSVDPYILMMSPFTTKESWAVKSLDRHMFSSEEGMKGTMYEKIARFILKVRIPGARKPPQFFDCQLYADGFLTFFELKSGSNWGNSSQWDSLRRRFTELQRNHAPQPVRLILGIAYGKSSKGILEHYDGKIIEIRGQEFWHYITDEPDFYIELGKRLASGSKAYNSSLILKRNTTINRLISEAEEFCFPNGQLDTELILRMNSERPVSKEEKGQLVLAVN
jgi:hypothetical protein